VDEKKKRLLDNFLSLGALQIFSYVIPLVTLPYLSRVLGVEKFGVVFFALAFTTYFNILIDFGFGMSATREIAINRHNNKSISNIFNSVITIKMLLVLLSFFVLVLTIIFIPKIRENYIVFLLSFLMCVGNAIYPVWFFQGMEKMKYITFLNILSKTIFLVLIFIFIKQQNDYIIVPLLNSLGFLVAGLIGFYFAVKEFRISLYIPHGSTIKQHFKYSSEFFMTQVSVSLYTNTNTVCLGFVGSEFMVGLYVAAEKIYSAINGLKAPLVTALYPFITRNKDIKLYRKIFKFAISVSFIISCFAFIFAKDIISIFYGVAMTEAYKVLRIFCILFFVNVPSVLLGYPLLGALGHTHETNWSVVYSSIFHLIGLVTLISLKGLTIYTMAYMVLITTSVELLMRVIPVVKYKLWNYDKLNIEGKRV